MIFKLGLRAKATLLASFFLILPWLGYLTILELEKMLQHGQEQTLISTTSALATALHERPNLFNTHANILKEIEIKKDLYAYPLQTAITLDGQLNDWKSLAEQSLIYNQDQAIYQADKNTNNPISFLKLLGTKEEYLYGYLQVTDKTPLLRHSKSRFINRNDHLIIAMSSPSGELHRYIISVNKEGWFNGYTFNNTDKQPQREKRIQGIWMLTNIGYNIEFRLPLSMLGNKLGFSLHTTSDSQQGVINNIIASSNTQNVQQLGTILTASSDIDKILQGLPNHHARVWVVDKHQRVLARSGNIHQANGLWNEQVEKRDGFFQPFYNLFLSKPNHDFVDDFKNVTKLNDKQVYSPLTKQATLDTKATIITVSSPIFVAGKVVGFVVAQETTNGILTLRNNALQKLLNILIAIILIGTLLLFLFSANIASRITKLRNQSNAAIDDQGKISAPFTPSSSSDEIGELSRGLSDMVNRLGQYHRYLENLASRLSHELRTPVAVVRSSLENLALLPHPAESQKYITRSQQGISRLNRILTNMSEASRLEQSLQRGEKIHLPLNELLTGAVQGYQMTYPEQLFTVKNTQYNVNIYADPDFIVQCLDKLVNNAIEFSKENSAIIFSLHVDSKHAILSIENMGPLLPDNMNEALLNSMVSIRKTNTDDETHLGLGLFIAKMICDFHQARITIKNNQTNNGVRTTLFFPLISTRI